MAGLVIGFVSLIAGLWFIREKLSGKKPEGNMFTAWFGFAFAGPAAAVAYVYVVLQFVSHHYFQKNPLMIFPAMVPAALIYWVVMHFFGGSSKDE